MPRPAVAPSFLLAFILLTHASGTAQPPPPPSERVRTIAPPATPLPAEADSRSASRFSFLAYGDTRGRRDGIATAIGLALFHRELTCKIEM
jgi:hypothetical protein